MPDTPSPPRPLLRIGLTLTLLALLLLTAALLMPGTEGPGRIPHLDKLFHFIGFFGLVLPFACIRPRLAWVAAAVAAAYGGGIELVQPLVGRGAEWGDALANLAGALSGAALGRWLHPRLVRRWPRAPRHAPPHAAQPAAKPAAPRLDNPAGPAG
jgi:VanZ family protein